MRTFLAIACVTLALLSAEGADVSSATEPVGHYIGTGASTGESKDVSSIIPQFQTGKEWAAADAKRQAGYNRANAVYKKLNAKAFKAQGAQAKELNSKADKAQMKLKEAKESIQKKYAKDDPADFGEGPMSSSDIADKKLDAAAKKTESGSMGASGTPRQMKWYTDGVISSDSYRDEEGHYLLGASRRRVGAGFGRRRRFSAAKVTKKAIVKSEQGHELLKAMGKAHHQTPTETADIMKRSKAEEEKKKEEEEEEKKEEEEKLPPGVVVADKKLVNDEDADTLKATGAGEDAQVDSTAHFTPGTDTKIVGQKTADIITGGGKEDDGDEDEFTELEVIKMVNDVLP